MAVVQVWQEAALLTLAGAVGLEDLAAHRMVVVALGVTAARLGPVFLALWSMPAPVVDPMAR